MSGQTKSPGTKANMSTERLLRIMEFMSEQNDPVKLSDIAGSLGMNASTTLRFINTLVKNGYVAQDEATSKYYMTYKICILAGRQMDKLKNWSAVRPYMEQISKMFGETCCLAVEKDMKVVYVEVVESPGSMIRSMQRIGNVAPMHCTGIGKLLLTNYTEAELDDMIERVGLKRFTDQTITTREGLLKELEHIRETGRAYDNEECEIGARCIALPVRGSEGSVIAGISVTGPFARLTDEMIDERIDTMREIVAKVSEKMGYISGTAR